MVPDGDGLYIEVMPSGSKFWRFRDQSAGADKKITLGKFPLLSLQEAREQRFELLKGRSRGEDIRAVLTPPVKATFEAVAHEWLSQTMEGEKAESHLKLVRSRLRRYLLPALGKRPIAEISARDLLEVLRGIEILGFDDLPHRVRIIAGQIFQYAVLTNQAPHNIVSDLRGALQPERHKHFGSITVPRDVAELMRRIHAYPSTVVRLCLLFSAYTFQRPGEIRSATWDEFDIDTATWTIPAERMKMKRPHLVPLSRQVIDILRQLQQLRPLAGSGPFIFPAPRSLKADQCMSENTLRMAFLTMGYQRGEMTAHGFRSMASTNLNAMGVNPELIELQLAHQEANKVRAAYNHADRLPDRREMMQRWADWLDDLTK